MLYIRRGWRRTKTLPKHICDIFFKAGNSICAILIFGKASLAPAKWPQTFRFPSMFLIRVTTPGAFRKLFRPSVDIPSTEVELKCDLKWAII